MVKTVHLEVIKGADTGKTFSIPENGARIGRSSKNDIMLDDPLMSRHHSRVFFKDKALWITDLGSANETLVNDKSVTEAGLNPGDRIQLGDTILKVLNAGEQKAASAPPPATSGKTGGEPLVNLGFDGEPQQAAAQPAGTRRKNPLLSTTGLLGMLGLVLIIAMAAWLPQILKKPTPPSPRQQPDTITPGGQNKKTLEVVYEKVQANPESIFRYALRITPNGMLAVQIDDLANDRHVRKEKRLNEDYLQQLAQELEQSGFFSLQEKYQGVQPDILDSWDLSITINRRTHRCHVINRVEPDIFRDVRETIENAGKNELSLWAVQFSAETLLTLAEESYLQGKKLYDERMVKDQNLAEAIKVFEEAEWYLETLEPKPDFYPDLITSMRQCRNELDARYEDHNFRARRAIQLRDWNEAARELRTIMALIPDREDERYQEARKNLLDVERRIETER